MVVCALVLCIKNTILWTSLDTRHVKNVCLFQMYLFKIKVFYWQLKIINTFGFQICASLWILLNVYIQIIYNQTVWDDWNHRTYSNLTYGFRIVNNDLVNLFDYWKCWIKWHWIDYIFLPCSFSESFCFDKGPYNFGSSNFQLKEITFSLNHNLYFIRRGGSEKGSSVSLFSRPFMINCEVKSSRNEMFTKQMWSMKIQSFFEQIVVALKRAVLCSWFFNHLFDQTKV